jgi:hypothetical protein
MVLSKKLADGGLSGKIGGEDFRWLKPQPTQRAHELIDRMAPGQIAAVVGLMEILLDPVARSLANAPFDDESVSDEETRDIVEARAAYACDEVVSKEEKLAEFGLTADDFERMGREAYR